MNCSDNKKPTAPRPAITPTRGLQMATRPTRGVDHRAVSRLNVSRSQVRALRELEESAGFDGCIARLSSTV